MVRNPDQPGRVYERNLCGQWSYVEKHLKNTLQQENDCKK